MAMPPEYVPPVPMLIFEVLFATLPMLKVPPVWLLATLNPDVVVVPVILGEVTLVVAVKASATEQVPAMATF
jgi:hypothetical protein